MKRFNLVSFVVFVLGLLPAHSQSVIYSISATIDESSTPLDSLLFENLDNQTRFLMGNLPELEIYEIDLSSQLLVTSVGPPAFLPESAFRLIHSIPGEASILLPGQVIEDTRVKIFSMSGQEVFSRHISHLDKHDILNITLPQAGVYILSVSTPLGGANFKVYGSTASLRGGWDVSATNSPISSKAETQAPIETHLKSASYDNGFSYQPGDSIRVTAFLGEYYTYPHGTRIYESKAIEFSMLKGTSDSTGVSDMYRPVADESYVVLDYDTITGGARFVLLSDTISLNLGNIITLDLDTIGVIQRVVKITEESGDVIIETEPGYMDELFVDAQFNLDTRLMEPKKAIKSDSPISDIIEALTDENGHIHPMKVIYYGTDKSTITWSVFDNSFEKDHRVNIINFHKDLSNTDLYGRQGQDEHFYVDEGYASLYLDAVLEFNFEPHVELTEDTKVKKGDLDFFKFYLDGDAGFKTKLALDMARSRERKDNKRMFSLVKASATFPVPPGVLVYITFSVDIYKDFHFKADASLGANWGFESLHSLKAGGKYSKATDDFSPIWDYTPVNTVYPLNIEGEVNAFARLELYPRADIRLYGFYGPYAEIVPFVQGSYNAKMESQSTSAGNETFLAWDSSLDIGLDLRLGTSLNFILSTKDFSLPPINCFNWTLWSSPANIELLTNLPEEVNPGEEIELRVRVTDLLGVPVPAIPVNFQAHGELSKQFPQTGSSGVATTYWTPGHSVGEKTFKAAIFGANMLGIDEIYGSISVIESQQETGTFTDTRDGQTYKWVKIGDQIWMAENLKATKYFDGTPIEYPGNDDLAWENNTDGASALYMNDTSWKDSYGVLYNWYAVSNNKRLCPAGWRVPREADWAELITHAGGEIVAGGKLKSTRTEPEPHPRWAPPNTGATNEFGFSALPGGFRWDDGPFGALGSGGIWWSASESYYGGAWGFTLNTHFTTMRRNPHNKASGHSVRCVKD